MVLRFLLPRSKWLALLLGLAAFFYFHELGRQVLAKGLLGKYDVFFNADAPRVVSELTDPRASHHRGAVHPFFGLLAAGVGIPTATAMGSGGAASIALVAACGGVCCALMWLLLHEVGVPFRLRCLWALVFALAATSLCAFVNPDTYAFACVFNLASLLAILRMRRAGSVLGIVTVAVATACAFGMNAIDLANGCLVFAVSVVSLAGLRNPRRIVVSGVAFAVATAVAIVLLSRAQDAWAPGYPHFWEREEYSNEHYYYAVGDWERAHALARHLFVYCFALPPVQPVVTWQHEYVMATCMPKSLCKATFVDVPQLVAVATIVGLAALGMRREWRFRGLACVAAWLAFCLVFFMYYGDDLMLYSSLWFPYWLLVLAIGTRRLETPRQRALLTAALVVLCVVELTATRRFFLETVAKL
jgi:hypothetical protein